MNPQDVRKAVSLAIASDTETVDLLAINAPWNDPTAPRLRVNSIVPMRTIGKLTPPYIGIQAGPLTNMEVVSYESFMYIRVYDNQVADYITIDRIIARLVKLLHDTTLPMDTTVNTSCRLEFIQPEAFDEALNQIYRELQFKLVIL